MFTNDNQCIIESIQQKALIHEKLKHKTLEKENAELRIRLNDMEEKLKLLTTSKFM
jgi:IS1 family transposase